MIPQTVLRRAFTNSQLQTVEGSPVTVRVANGTVTVNEAMITGADVATTNGVLHSIDRILVPPGIDLRTVFLPTTVAPPRTSPATPTTQAAPATTVPASTVPASTAPATTSPATTSPATTTT